MMPALATVEADTVIASINIIEAIFFIFVFPLVFLVREPRRRSELVLDTVGMSSEKDNLCDYFAGQGDKRRMPSERGCFDGIFILKHRVLLRLDTRII
jgi:hypothetical protein